MSPVAWTAINSCQLQNDTKHGRLFCCLNMTTRYARINSMRKQTKFLKEWPQSCQWNSTLSGIEEFENAALLLRLGLQSTLIRHENGTLQLRKRSSNKTKLKTPALRFSVNKNEIFENVQTWYSVSARVLLTYKSIMTTGPGCSKPD